MRLKSFHPSKTTCQALMRNDGHFSNLVDGLCFDIRSKDKTTLVIVCFLHWINHLFSYLCGTIEGVIHRCSTIYNEKYLESFTGHTGPVYKIHWSPFVENLFLSASADWTIRLWMIGFNRPCMTFASTNSKMFFDAIWSPKSATMFFAVSETTIEIWDLSKSTYDCLFLLQRWSMIDFRLDPMCTAHCSDKLTLTSIAYAADSDVSIRGKIIPMILFWSM